MNRIRQLIIEIHRRSVWQVLSVYLVASWVALQVAESIGESAGLPDWVQPFAFILLIIGLPVVLATAVVQEGGPVRADGDGTGESGRGTPPPADTPAASPAPSSASSQTPSEGVTPTGGGTEGSANGAESQLGAAIGGDTPMAVQGDAAVAARRLFTWRNAISGGVAAFLLLALAVGGYFFMWSRGIGPVGSLAAQGVFSEGDAVILADFQNTSNDPALGGMVTEALRVDLAASSIMTLVEPARIQETLGQMGRVGEEALDEELAREVAIRDGFKAVVQGTVGSAGTGYLFVASLVAAENGAILATFREAADGPDEVIEAIDKLSQDIREKAGESLRIIKAEEPLEDVTTSSLEALRKYAEAGRFDERGEPGRAITALEEALELDPDFAMAHRRMAVVLNNSGGSLTRQVEAATRAYQLRDRLTERERYLATAYYHRMATRDLAGEIQAYQAVLDRFPDDQAASNNIAIAFMSRGRADEAVAAMERAAAGPGASASARANLPGYLAMVGRVQEAEEALARLAAEDPNRGFWVAFNRLLITAFQADGPGLVEASQAFLAMPEAQGVWRSTGIASKGSGYFQMGRIREAREALEEGAQEMTNLGISTQVLQMAVFRSWLDHLLQIPPSPTEMERTREEFNRLLDSIPPLARSYDLVIPALAVRGDEIGAQGLLDRWRVDDVPSAQSPAFQETRRAAEGLLLMREDPARALEILNDLARSSECPFCSVWERGLLAQELGRWEEARSHFTTALTGGIQEFMAVSAYRVLAHRRLGQVYEALGDSAKAAEHYATFAGLWVDADPEYQPWVREARERAEALSAADSGLTP